MHREIVGKNPKVGMQILYHRNDDMWLLWVTKVQVGFVTYKYKLYRAEASATHRRREIDIDLLVDVLHYRRWKGGTTNSPEDWYGFITGSSYRDGGSTRVNRVEYLGSTTVPSWEL